MKEFIKSFKYAFEGLILAIKPERNLKIHFVMMVLVIIFGFIFKISNIEWMICIILFGLVISCELINTAIEQVVDIVLPNKDDRAKRAKDISASAVLVSAISSAIIGLIIFIPKIFG